MTTIPEFPIFEPVTMDMAEDLHAFCEALTSGISEFTFANIHIDTLKYKYQASQVSTETVIVTGISPSRSFMEHQLEGPFFMVLGAIPEDAILKELFKKFRYWKNMSLDSYEIFSKNPVSQNFQIFEDRDNFDYLYDKNDLALLQGKDFHKKKNLVNAFTSTYSTEVKPLDIYTAKDALSVLQSWKQARPADDYADYKQCKFALENFISLKMNGIVVYADGIPAGFSLGEYMCNETMFVVMFEKGINSYKGIYQFINRSQAIDLPGNVITINREQDLGNPGLRQAKMTYRPCSFTKKYLVLPESM